MYCRYCGTQLADNTAFCIKCGEKTVKLHPRTVLPLVPPEPQGAAENMAAALRKARNKSADFLKSAAERAKRTVQSSRILHFKLPEYVENFSPRMWTVCGILIGLIIIMLVESIGAICAERLVFPPLREIPQVWIPAALICLIIALTTVVRGYNYRQTDEYKTAVEIPETRDAVESVLAVDPGVLDDLVGVVEPDSATIKDTERLKEPISEEAADIIAELEKLSLNL